MSWSYSGDPTTSKLDEYRFLIADTDSTAPIMQNEEIQYIIDTYGEANTVKVLYHLYSRVATLFARDIKRRLGPQSEDPTERTKYYASQVEYYRKQMTQAIGLSDASYAYPKVFRKGMQNNPPYYDDSEV